MITVLQGISGKYFSCSIPDVELAVSGESVSVTVAVDDETVFNETLYPVDGVITLRDLSGLLNPYARQRLVVKTDITALETNSSDTPLTMTASVIYGSADVGIDAGSFCSNYFLSILMGDKETAVGRLEYLHYIGTEPAECQALYADGRTETFSVVAVGGNDRYTTIDVSPQKFMRSDGAEPESYTVVAGSRRQTFILNHERPDCAPILIFVNSFGCDELLYCTGVHKVAPSYKRSSSYISGKLRNYDIEETRTFKADTGILNTAMANWFDDVLRSDFVRIVNFIGGNPDVGHEVVITDSKSEHSNAYDELPRFTFSYQYSQRNHNVLNMGRAGRIFDNTFDRTFN
ncbi:MAG: hypothetical protein J6K19_00935 [Prevotella sp.]|nr:hypothetical protein [Prevotella sp.]